MGVVWRVWQESLQRMVALKMIRSGLLATPGEVQRFRREAEAAASLDYPHIVPIYEIGEDEGRHFFSMKLIEGGNLADLSAALVAAMARALLHRCAGDFALRRLSHAHERAHGPPGFLGSGHQPGWTLARVGGKGRAACLGHRTGERSRLRRHRFGHAAALSSRRAFHRDWRQGKGGALAVRRASGQRRPAHRPGRDDGVRTGRQVWRGPLHAGRRMARRRRTQRFAGDEVERSHAACRFWRKGEPDRP